MVRTPDNPTFWWGNFLLLPEPPATTDEAEEWLATFEREFPEARHRTFGIDGTSGTVDDLAAFTALGLEAEASSVMTAEAVHEPPRPDTEATYRPLVSDDDWAQQVEVSRAGEDMGDYHLAFVTARTAAERRLVEQGYGAWWGAFEGDRLLASMGLFTASPGLARFQSVKTHPDARGRGLAGTLVHRVEPLRVRRARRDDAGDGRRPRLPRDPDLPVGRVRRHRAAAAGGPQAGGRVEHRHGRSGRYVGEA